MTPESEQSILHKALIAGGAEPDTMIWRQNSGQAWVGKRMAVAVGGMVRVKPGMVVLENARPFTAACNGIGDVMGVSAGVPIAAEAKTLTGSMQVSQINFRRRWEACGGKYILFRSADQLVQGIRDAKRG